MVCGCPTMPNRGAAEVAMRPSPSSLRPVIRACPGAWNPTAAAFGGMSCTRPSVIRKAPATRSIGTSDSADDSAPNNLVPSVSPSAWPASTTRTSNPLIFLRLSTSASCACAVSRVREPKFWLGLLSITTAATDDNGSRSSRVNDGLASASRMSASAVTRTAAPRARPSSSNPAITTMAAAASQSTGEGTSGVNAMPYCMPPLLLSQPLNKSRRVHLVGLVVSGQRIHHDVDAGAEGEFALPGLARSKRQHRLAVGAYRPGAGEIVRGDDDRRDAVSAPGRPRRGVG